MSKEKVEAIEDTGSTHDMDPKYGSLLSYLQASSGGYVNLVNGTKDPIDGYITTLVRLGDKVI